jgi:hypothetical protein
MSKNKLTFNFNTGCILKMWRNFTYVVVGHRRRLKGIKKIVPQKLNVNLFFDIEFFKYFFRVLYEASSSWLKLFRVFRLHPVHCPMPEPF